jgi:hypothetical protein
MFVDSSPADSDWGHYLATELNPMLDRIEYQMLGELGLVEAALDEGWASSEMEQLVRGCRDSLSRGDYPQAVTRSRVLIERTLYDAERALGDSDPKKANLPLLYKRVSQRLNLDSKQQQTEYGDLLRGLAHIVRGVGNLRNDAGGVHGHSIEKARRVKERHARLAVNAAYTFTKFLTETLEYQMSGEPTGGASVSP